MVRNIEIWGKSMKEKRGRKGLTYLKAGRGVLFLFSSCTYDLFDARFDVLFPTLTSTIVRSTLTILAILEVFIC